MDVLQPQIWVVPTEIVTHKAYSIYWLVLCFNEALFKCAWGRSLHRNVVGPLRNVWKAISLPCLVMSLESLPMGHRLTVLPLCIDPVMTGTISVPWLCPCNSWCGSFLTKFQRKGFCCCLHVSFHHWTLTALSLLLFHSSEDWARNAWARLPLSGESDSSENRRKFWAGKLCH